MKCWVISTSDQPTNSSFYAEARRTEAWNYTPWGLHTAVRLAEDLGGLHTAVRRLELHTVGSAYSSEARRGLELYTHCGWGLHTAARRLELHTVGGSAYSSEAHRGLGGGGGSAYSSEALGTTHRGWVCIQQ